MRLIEPMIALFDSPQQRRTHLWLPILMGILGGFILALTLVVMEKLSHLIWQQQYQQNPFVIFAVFAIGGLIIGLLQQKLAQLKQTQSGQGSDPLRLGIVILIGILAVGLGASIGPEAALIAAGAEMAWVIGHYLHASQRESAYIERLGQEATMGGAYSAPAAALEPEMAEAPKIHIFARVLTIICAIVGFYVSMKLLNPEGSLHRIHLMTAEQSLNLWAPLAAALVAGFLTVLFVRLGHRVMQDSEQFMHSPLYRGVFTGVLMGMVFAIHPFLRGAGYYELEYLQTHEIGLWILLLIAVLKLMLTLLSATGGWLGGVIFPLFFVGGALGAAMVQIIPGNVDAAMLAAMTSATYISLRKPIILLMLMVLLVENLQIPALLVGLGVGMLLERLLMGDMEVKGH
ncbi:chloride channel protein [Thiofilum flexile]|uniref:chloride channel protein n=1 Tax=Thiofilum flexile TaxID=125627 RepID=UPI000373AC87|nr:chloride channel protein [Thiofilum flexile]